MVENHSALLKEAVNLGIISIDNVQADVMNKKIQVVEQFHPYAITPPKNAAARWQTYYLDERSHRRKLIRAKTKEELLKKLYEYYKDLLKKNELCFETLYQEWLEYKTPLTSSNNTLQRYEQRYRRYLSKSKLVGKRLTELDELILESECNRIVKEFALSHKEWVNVKTILNGMFDYAYRKHYISENPMPRIRIAVKYRQVVRKPGETQTFNREEHRALNRFLDEGYAESHDPAYLAIKLNFYLGLRVGELVALKWEDYTFRNLHIVREEVRDQKTGEISVVEHTKTNTDRFVTLVPSANRILQRVEHQGEYIFMKDHRRITASQIASILRRFAKSSGMPIKSSHKIRKTYASNLSANHVPLEVIREQLGHSSLQTTLGYIYNPLTEKETYELLAAAL